MLVLSSMNTDTRKSSCVNARGIPTTAYQLLHLLSCTGRGYPCWGRPSLAGGYPGVPPHLDLAGVTPHQTWPGYPLAGPGQGTPHQVRYPLLDLPGVTPCLDLAGLPPHLDLAGVPPIRSGWGTPPPIRPEHLFSYYYRPHP